MKWYNQRRIRCIAAHAFKGKGALTLPGYPVLAGLQGPAERGDEIVGCVRTSENRPPAKIQAHDVGLYFGIVCLGNDTAPEAQTAPGAAHRATTGVSHDRAPGRSSD